MQRAECAMTKPAEIAVALGVKKNFFGRMRLLKYLLDTSLIFFLVKGIVWLVVFAYIAMVGSGS